MSQAKRPRSLSQELEGADPPQWVREASEYYQRTGVYRIEDLARVMGDQTTGVSVSEPGPAPAKREDPSE